MAKAKATVFNPTRKDLRRPGQAGKMMTTFSSQAMVESDSARSAFLGSHATAGWIFGVHGAIGVRADEPAGETPSVGFPLVDSFSAGQKTWSRYGKVIPAAAMAKGGGSAPQHGPPAEGSRTVTGAASGTGAARCKGAAKSAASSNAESVPIRIVTVNATAAGSLKKYLTTTEAHIVLAQEVKTSGTTSEQLKVWAASQGWKCLIADAVFSKATSCHSAGVAILARDWIGIGWPPGRGPTHYESRVLVALIECPGVPAFLAASAYLKTGIGGPAPYNLQLLEFVGQVTSCHRLPWLLGADFQMSPQSLAETRFPEAARARIVADMNPVGTCTSASGTSIIDYFIVTEDFADVVGQATTILDAITAPHRPVQIIVPANAGQMKKLAFVAVQKLPCDPVFGPRPAPPSWEAAERAALRAVESARTCTSVSRVKHALAGAYRTFAETLETEVADYSGVELLNSRCKRGRKVRTKWVPVLGPPRKPTSPVGVALRWMERRAAEMHRCERNSEWVQLNALCGVQPPTWLPASLVPDYTSLVALAKSCAAHAKAASQAGQNDDDDAELPPLQQREEELTERATFAEAADAQETRAAWRL